MLSLLRSGVAPPPPPSSGDPIAEEYVDPKAAVDLPPSTSEDSGIRRMSNTIMTVQAAYGQLLVDVLMELQALRVNLASVRWSSPSPPFEMSLDCPLTICHKKGEYIWMEIGGDFCCFGALDCI